MNEKKSNGFAALILSAAVVIVAVLGVKLAGGSAVTAQPSQPDVSGEIQGDAGKYAPGTYTATEKGFQGDVTVTVTIGEGDVITDVQMVGPDETPALGGAALEQLQAAMLENQQVPADAVSGATFSSSAAIKAAQSCLDQAAAAVSAEGGAAGSAYKAGVYTHTEKGFQGDVTVTITIGDDGVITDVVIEGASETPALGGMAMEQMQAYILDNQAAPVDAVSGATFTSNAVIAAAAACLDEAAN